MILEGLYSLAKILAKGIGRLLYYTLPLIFCVVAFFLGVAACDGVFNGKYEAWEMQQRVKHTHTVNIHWGDGDITVLEIRDDLNWNICGCNDIELYYKNNLDYYKNEHESDKSVPELVMPQKSKREGYKFIGLFMSPLGGTQFVNSAGYSVRTIEFDIDLYAVWQEVD